VFASVGMCPRERLDLRLLGVLAITPEIASHTHILASQAPMPQYLISGLTTPYSCISP
jgi:hypothetical protein